MMYHLYRLVASILSAEDIYLFKKKWSYLTRNKVAVTIATSYILCTNNVETKNSIIFLRKNTHLIVYPFVVRSDIIPLHLRHPYLVLWIPLNIYSKIKSETKTTTQIDRKNKRYS